MLVGYLGWPETHQCYECKEARLAAAGLTLNRPHTGPHGHNMAPGNELPRRPLGLTFLIPTLA